MTTALQSGCPYCGAQVHASTPLQPDHGPLGPGDAALCIACERPLLLVSGPFGLALRIPTADELVLIHAAPGFYEASRALRDWKIAEARRVAGL